MGRSSLCSSKSLSLRTSSTSSSGDQYSAPRHLLRECFARTTFSFWSKHRASIAQSKQIWKHLKEHQNTTNVKDIIGLGEVWSSLCLLNRHGSSVACLWTFEFYQVPASRLWLNFIFSSLKIWLNLNLKIWPNFSFNSNTNCMCNVNINLLRVFKL